MKNTTLKLLKQSYNTPQEKFNALLSAMVSANGNPNLIRNYNARGYTPEGLKTLEYDICQHLGISEREIREFQLPKPKTEVPVAQEPSSDVPENIIPLEVKKSRFSEILQELNDEEKTGLKISTQYPFLREENCPNEFKILVNDAITAYHNAKEKHEGLFAIFNNEGNPEATNEEIYAIASELLSDFELNREIHEELEHYTKTGEILGNHKIFGDLKLKREVEAMSAEDLAKTKNNIKSYISKKKKDLEKADNDERKASLEQQITYLEKKRDLVDARLKEK